MAQIRIPFLVEKKNRDGTTRWNWQPSKALREAGWTPLALGKDRASAMRAAEARNAEVDRWQNGGQVKAEVKRKQQAGTLGALIARYRKEVLNGVNEDGSPRLAKTTRKVYETSLRRLEAWAGKQPLAFITKPRVAVLRKTMIGPAAAGGIGHHGAFATLKMGRVLMEYAIDCELLEQGKNPFEKFKLAPPDPRDVIWSPPAREALIQSAYDCGMPSVALAIMLGYGIGQREQDLLPLTQRQYVAIPEHKMQPEDYATLAALAPDRVPRGMRVKQLKTGAWVEVPIVGLTRWAVEANIETARRAGATTILLDDRRGASGIAALYDGEAGQTRFQRDFAEVREWAVAAALFDGEDELAAELETLQFRDLRRTCVVYLGELGMDAHLIAGVTGHDIDETQRILRVYMPRTTGRAARAIALASVREAKEAGKERVPHAG